MKNDALNRFLKNSRYGLFGQLGPDFKEDGLVGNSNNIKEGQKVTESVEVGDIVQLSPSITSNKMFAGCLMTVTEVKTWGVQGFVQALGEKGEPGGFAFYRATTGTFERTGGKAVWMPASDEVSP